MKLCLGTVQFGMNYGICGGKKPPVEDVVHMLDYATQNGVDAIDTAAAYGTAESVVGEFLRRRTIARNDLFIVSKFSADIFSGVAQSGYGVRLGIALRDALLRLRTDYLDAYICHVPTAVKDDSILAALAELKKSGMVRHVGFSVYEVEEARACIASGIVDFMQLPYSVFDQRMADSGVLAEAAAKGINIHSRSAFVQGLMLLSAEDVPEKLAAARPLIRELDRLCRMAMVSRSEFAMAFVKASATKVSHLVFGVENIKQLKENISAFNANVSDSIVDDAVRVFKNADPRLIMPNKWRI